MKKKNRLNLSLKNVAFIKIISVVLVFLLFNILSLKLITGIKFDLTFNKLYTVTDNTYNIIRNIEEPINIKLFFSDSLSNDIPQIREYEKR